MRLRVSSQAIAAAESRAASNPVWTRPARCWAMEAIAAEASVSPVTTIAHALKDAFLMAWEGARAGLRHFGGRAGLGPAQPHRARARRIGRAPGFAGDGARRGLLVVLLCGRRDRQEPVREAR